MCPNLVTLSLPYLTKGLRLHPENTSLKELIASEGSEDKTLSDLESLYLELFPVLMSKGTAQIKLWNVHWACKLLRLYSPLLRTKPAVWVLVISCPCCRLFLFPRLKML